MNLQNSLKNWKSGSIAAESAEKFRIKKKSLSAYRIFTEKVLMLFVINQCQISPVQKFYILKFSRAQSNLTHRKKRQKILTLWEPEDEIHVADRNSFLSLSIHRNPTSILNTYILMNCLFSVSYVTSNTIYLYKASSSVIRTKEKRYYNDPLHAPWFILWNDMLLLNTFFQVRHRKLIKCFLSAKLEDRKLEFRVKDV